jgi:hypothetical protein
MSKKDQHQEPEAFPTSTAGNGSRSPSREEEQDARSRTKRAAARKATGPRTTQGKNRSRLNAIKHGLYFKAVLLEGESEADYLSLLGGLQDYYWPEGQMESAEVENVAVLLWRKRRFFQAENAVISENAIFTGIDA